MRHTLVGSLTAAAAIMLLSIRPHISRSRKASRR